MRRPRRSVDPGGSPVTQVVLPTLAFVAIWALVAALAAGCGLLVRHGLLSAFDSRPDRGLRRCDVWIGLAALVAYLLVWNLFLAITWWTWALPLAAAAAGLVRGMRGTVRPQLDRRGGVALGAVGVGWLVLANQALGPIDDYDFGLYHADLIAYAEKYAAIPGLANLHSRLGAGDAHLLLGGVSRPPPARRGRPTPCGGLLLALLLLDVSLRLSASGRRPVVHEAARGAPRARHGHPRLCGALPACDEPEPRPRGVRRSRRWGALPGRMRRERTAPRGGAHGDCHARHSLR